MHVKKDKDKVGTEEYSGRVNHYIVLFIHLPLNFEPTS